MRTKILATLGPATESEETIKSLYENGASIFRFNLKYNTQSWHKKIIEKARKVGGGIVVDIPSNDFKLEFDDYDFIALSYLKNSSEVIDLKKRFERTKKRKIKVIAKIENRSAMKDLEAIIENSEGIMVARGDLAKDVDFPELAYLQKTIIDKCRRYQKPVIVATEMLMSMTESTTPTRAEATDVANAVFDGADCLMLSQETTLGKYPELTVDTMSKIITYSENTNELRVVEIPISNLGDKIIQAAVNIAKSESDKFGAIVVFTKSGRTARAISAYRLKTPIIGITDSENVMAGMELSYGVVPYLMKIDKSKFDTDSELFKKMANDFGWKTGINLMMIHGNNWLESGSVNTLSIKRV